MADTSLQLLRTFASLRDDEREAFPFQNPSLLASEVQLALQTEISPLEPEERGRLAAALESLQNLRKVFEQRPGQYPFGLGPLERLWIRQAQGEISSDYAEELAAGPELLSQLSPVYLNSLSVVNLDSAKDGNWRNSIQLQRLLAVSAKALPDAPEIEEARKRIALDSVEVAAIYLGQIPDGRVYRHARDLGDQAVATDASQTDRAFVGEMLHRLGVLHLDPYTANRASTNYDQISELWHKRLYDELGDDVFNIDEKELEMPTPADALRRAEEYFRRALGFREQHKKGLTLKALAQTLEWLELLKQPIDEAELIKLCRQALELLDGNLSPQQRLAVFAMLVRRDEPIDSREVESVFHTSLDEYIQRLGSKYAMDLVKRVFEILTKTDQFRALDLMTNARPLFRQYGDEADRYGYWTIMLNVVRQTFASDISLKRPPGGLQQAVKELHERSRKEKWDVRRTGGALITLASISSNWNEEADALELLDKAKRLAPVFSESIDDSIAYLRANLLLGLGANRFNDHQWMPAIDVYAKALEAFLDINMTERALECLRRIEDAAAHVDEAPDAAASLLQGLAPLAVRLETVLGEPAIRELQKLSKYTIARLSSQGIVLDIFFLLVQMVKGLRFATALSAGAHFDVAADERGSLLLDEIKNTERALAQEGAVAQSDSGPLLDENLLMNAYVRPSERRSGDTLSERLSNLQHSFDERLNKQLLLNVTNKGQTFLSTAAVRVAIDAKTVIAYFYLGRSATGTIAVYVLLLTREDGWIGSVTHEFPDSVVAMGDGEMQILVSPIALLVESARNEVMSQGTGPRPLTPEAEKLLQQYLKGYFGSLTEKLAELRAAGKDHLCIIPHGPLHYYPLHLLGEVQQPLAKQWKVSYLPNLYLLVSRRGQPSVQAHRDHTLTAIGVSFTQHNPFGLAEIPESVDEAQKVAATFKTQPILENQATKSAVIAALHSSRYVHISTHGRHNVAAPAFQCVYLSPEGESDGRLFAHELLAFDLRGLELLTLSACETALGRFDTADNLRGLPASFLLAGVATIVGTLWSVAVSPAEFFFTSLYEQLSAVATRLEAFTTAQQATRVKFPKYRHWGAFYLMGEWD